ncbi:MAG: DUF4160 domain-containing protein [Peptostreptococcaceae bacterium]
MPKALLDFLGYKLYFWSNEYSGTKLEPIHIHVSKGEPTEDATKIWIKPDGIELCNNNSQISPSDLKKIMKYIANNRAKVVDRWYKHFGL